MKRSLVIAPPETGQDRSSTTSLTLSLCPIASVNQTNLPFEEKGEESHPSLPYLAMMMTHSLGGNFFLDTMQSCSFTAQ